MGPNELWGEPWEGLPEEEGAWEWDLVDEEEDGAIKKTAGQTAWLETLVHFVSRADLHKYQD